MKISEVMNTDVALAKPTMSLKEAASLMQQRDIGALPVADDDRLIGMVTDRDLVVRGVAKGLSCEESLKAVMSDEVRYCFDDDSLRDVAENMAQLKVRRLPVVNRDKRLVGIVSLANIADGNDSEVSQELLDRVARPH